MEEEFWFGVCSHLNVEFSWGLLRTAAHPILWKCGQHADADRSELAEMRRAIVRLTNP